MFSLAQPTTGFWEFWERQIVPNQPLTYGMLIIGLMVVLVGFVVSWLISRLLLHRLLPKFRIHPGGIAAIEAIVFYVLLTVFIFTGLNLMHVPLGAFAFLGGALAIGVGFGSQAILENFISGLIILAERPIRAGDLVEIDSANNLIGTVERIGARSTRIRTGSNIEVIVPNSAFLQNNVVNWTLSTNRVRTHVTVGVAYGSPTDEVTRCLLEAARERDDVLNPPEPFVWFTDFGDNALNFELHFWVHMRNVSDRRRIESSIRYRIDELFRQAGITIAFPQRDVHLDTLSPLRVQVLPGGQQDHSQQATADDEGAAS